jgi:hypothetical protein
MQKYIIKFFVAFGFELLASIIFLFLTLIPLLYMLSQFQESKHIWESALATVLVNMVGRDPAHMPSTALEFQGAIIGLGLGLAVLVILWRLIVLVIRWEPESPNEERLFEIIHQVRRKNGEREEYCSWLLHLIDEDKHAIQGVAHEPNPDPRPS